MFPPASALGGVLVSVPCEGVVKLRYVRVCVFVIVSGSVAVPRRRGHGALAPCKKKVFLRDP
jgi:hypothetical protein